MNYNQLDYFCTDISFKYADAGVFFSEIEVGLETKDFFYVLAEVSNLEIEIKLSYSRANFTLLNGIKVVLFRRVSKKDNSFDDEENIIEGD